MNILKIKLLPVFVLLFIGLGSTSGVAQVYDPVTWSFDSKYLGDQTFELQFHATIEGKWHLYGMNIPPDGPIPTSFTFEQSDAYTLVGKTTEPKGITVDDPVFGMKLTYFEHQATFKQKVEVSGSATSIKGELEFMVCDDGKCLPPEYVDFAFDVQVPEEKAAPKKEETQETAEASNEPAEAEAEVEKVEESVEPGILTPVSWTHSFEQQEDGTYALLATAKLDPKWHIYSLALPEDDGPIATEFNVLTKEGVEVIGGAEEIGELKTEYDPNFLMDLSFFDNEVTFKRVIRVDESVNQVTAEVYFMVCDPMRCLPPEAIEFTYNLTGKETAEEAVPTEDTESDSGQANRSGWAIFFLSFLGGFAALLTPCVFPMIPMTVSFFTKQSKTRAIGIRNAIIYGLSIVFIYTILGFAITVTFGADALNALSTNFWFNIIFFVLLVVFAISFLGAFEITLPSSWVNKADQASDKGGLIGIFFMAATLSIVSFSCTGPIIGTLLVDAAVNGGVMGPLLGMFGFSMALALPFGLFAAFPGWMNSLPKSGGWLNAVKVVLGFLELALAFKFLSNADLVVQAGILTRELFLAAWIGIFFALTLYLFGFIRMPHDSPLDRLSVGRALLATFTLIFTIYLIPGLWGAPLKLISGFPPPMFYSESPKGVGHKAEATVIAAAHGSAEIPKGADPEHCPHGLNCFHDYEEGMAYAKETGKPVMVDFTGWACVNCRKMEEQVWSDPRVLNRLRNDVVLISLYVDEKTRLPKDKQYTSETTGKKVKTIGNKWSDFQASRFGTNSQPYYVILNHQGDQLHESAAYDPDIEAFIDWLDRGKELFKSPTP